MTTESTSNRLLLVPVRFTRVTAGLTLCGVVPKALKMFLHVFKHFEDFQEDQFDFHTYCLRKMTLRTYVEMLRMEDELYHHIYYSKAAWGAIEAYLLLLDQPDKNAKVQSKFYLFA